MNERNALERQLAEVVRGAMRPPRPVDAAATVDDAELGLRQRGKPGQGRHRAVGG